MKNMKLAAKIGVGFGLVIIIAMGLGGVAIMNMVGVQGDAQRLNAETVPQVAVANNVERNSLQTMYNMRGFALSEDRTYWDQAQKYLSDVKKYLADAQTLAAKYPRLIELRKNATEAAARVADYEKLAQQTSDVTDNILESRKAQDAAAPEFMKACLDYETRNIADLQSAIARRASPSVQRNILAEITTINEIIDLGNGLRIANFKAQATRDYSILQAGLDQFNQLEGKVTALRGLSPDKNDLADYDTILKAGADYRAACEAILADGKQITDLNKSRGDAATAVLDAAQKTSESGLSDARSVTVLTAARLYSAVIVLVIGLAVAALIGIAIAVAITRAITAPLSRGVSFAQRVAGGDFTQQLSIHQKDEVGILADALNGMCVKLRTMVSTVQENAEQVASSSEQISASSQKLAEGAQSQASTLEETSASVEQLTASVDQVAEHAQSQASAVQQGTASMAQVQRSIEDVSRNLTEIATLARTSVDNAVNGAKAVQEVVSGINRIAESSEKIGGIIGVISDIADQTNLLALNASIEAARAGEHGRGFAVVADEVSKLAERSASSTKEIENLIRESVRNVSEGVKVAEGSQTAMEQIRDASQKVKEMIGSLSESMSQQVTASQELSKALDNINDMSLSISAATEEQTTNAKQVSKAVENVNDITQTAASSAEEMSAATEQLATMAQELQRLVAQFRIDAGRDAPAALVAAAGGNGSGNGHAGRNGTASRTLPAVG
ncbi:MAG TPA: methyl-accepting chemotaxis protein [Spirochaetia bacterium]|nr:methyl-accepting chemotaxis protein [Spirochaetia bacterium]